MIAYFSQASPFPDVGTRLMYRAFLLSRYNIESRIGFALLTHLIILVGYNNDCVVKYVVSPTPRTHNQ